MALTTEIALDFALVVELDGVGARAGNGTGVGDGAELMLVAKWVPIRS